MSRKTTKGRQVHPEGGVISVSPEERKQIRDRRVSLGLRQDELAAKAGCSPATVSNLETGAVSGRSKQLKRSVYAQILRVLKVAEGAAPTSADLGCWRADLGICRR